MKLETIIAGDTLDFTVEVPDYPASGGWTLIYRLTPRFTSPAQQPITLAAIPNADGARYDVRESPENTAAWAPGFYTWARWVQKSGARQTLSESGQLEIKPDPAQTTQGHDSRSFARKMLDAIEAALVGKATGQQLDLISYTIGSRVYQRDAKVLLPLRDKFRVELANEEAAERAAQGLDSARMIRVRFARA